MVRHGGAPLLDIALLRHTPGYGNGMAVGAIYFTGFTGVFLVLSVFFQEQIGLSALEAGLLVGGDNNAALSFKRALRLDPTSQAAREGEEAVVKKVDETVRELMAQGTSASLNEAEIAVRRAREIYPDRVAFESLESSLEAKRKE